MNQYLKPIQNPVSTRQEVRTSVSIVGSGLTYTLCDRTDLIDYQSNYFSSFNLPYNASALPTGSTFSLLKPELQQLNVDKIIITPLPSGYYNQIIDGRTITLSTPQISGTGLSAKTIVSSTYTTLDKTQTSELLGTNIAFLFCDEINTPYTGTTLNGAYMHSATTWNPLTSFVDRPPAVSYIELSQNDIFTDKRSYSGVNLAVNVPQGYPSVTNQGYNYDIPVGFVALDKGWIVYTHPKIVNNIPFNLGYNTGNTLNTGPTSATTDIYFLDNTNSAIAFEDINIQYKTSYIALVLPGEFFISTNPSWDTAKNYLEQINSTNGYDAVSISEIGMFNSKEEMIAVAKLDRPLSKNYGDLVTITLDINI